MTRSSKSQKSQPVRKPLAWLSGEIKSPPFTAKARQEAGMLLRLLQEGHHLVAPQAEPLPIVGASCGALRIRDENCNWRIMYRVDSDVILILEVYAKKSAKIPKEVIDRCQARLKRYDRDSVSKASKKNQ